MKTIGAAAIATILGLNLAAGAQALWRDDPEPVGEPGAALEPGVQAVWENSYVQYYMCPDPMNNGQLKQCWRNVTDYDLVTVTAVRANGHADVRFDNGMDAVDIDPSELATPGGSSGGLAAGDEALTPYGLTTVEIWGRFPDGRLAVKYPSGAFSDWDASRLGRLSGSRDDLSIGDRVTAPFSPFDTSEVYALFPDGNVAIRHPGGSISASKPEELGRLSGSLGGFDVGSRVAVDLSRNRFPYFGPWNHYTGTIVAVYPDGRLAADLDGGGRIASPLRTYRFDYVGAAEAAEGSVVLASEGE